ncbi:paired amphipathic helix protein Sin3a isoform X1 [Onthophagus taurus]|uniref:paired amphipathic helix protein Sin3a isoform X1 n=1 Tax=Onthophagus taurus TaxID=166361 RepID=UPI0039BE507B
MKRLRVDETVQEGSGPPLSGNNLYRSSIPNTTSAIAYSGAGTIKVVGSEGMQSSLYPPTPPVSYGVMPTAAVPHSGKGQTIQPLSVGGHAAQIRNKGASPPSAVPQVPVQGGHQGPAQQPTPPSQQQQGQQQSPGSNFQRLKVEDALSYLDSVKYKFGDKPQVYNDFLDIMKEFKNQSIDTPGVIQRVSNLFNGFPDLIDGFNTFLPPGYKIDVQKNDRGYAFQVSVSVPRPTGTMVSEPVQKTAMILTGSGIIHSNIPNPGGQQPVSGPVSSNAALPAHSQPLSLSSQHVSSIPPQAPPHSNPVLQQQHHATAGAPSAVYGNAVTPTLQSAATQQPHHLNLNSNGNNSTPSVQQQHHHHHHHHHHQSQQQPHHHNNTLQFSAAQAAVNQALQGGHTEAPQNQPVEFNHAINYVNKIKNRFQGQPDKYKRFLEILHTYQKEQRTLKESSQGVGGGKHLTEQEVYSQVAKLFENQSDLLAEFGQFLPDATSHINPPAMADHQQNSFKKQPLKPYGHHSDRIIDRIIPHHKPSHLSSNQLKRSPPYPNLLSRDAPLPKKHKLSSSCRDVTIAEAGKYCTLNDYAFFDKVRKAVRSQDVYNNFLRCLVIFNQEIVSKSELVQLVTPFLSKFPELMKWFRDFVGQTDVENIPYNVTRTERPVGEHTLDIDYSTAKRLGTSYCVIPPSQEGLKFSGRTQLCHEVLNNQWVSFPSWAEDNSFVGSRKNQYEEYMYRCEDERFELDVVIETNASTIRVLEGVSKKLSRMSPEEIAKYRLDDCLGGHSPILHQRALRRIYGDKAQDIIDGLKRSPGVAVPVVLRRLKAKEEEWREAQKGFNKIWRDQNEKYYLKSLDYQGINFKQNDVKALRSKNLFNEIETLFEERNEQNDESSCKPIVGPHLVFHYRDRTILDDAANLLIHHVKRQTGIQKGEKRRIKHILRQFVPDLFFHPRQQLSDDEREEDGKFILIFDSYLIFNFFLRLDDDKEDGDESPRGSVGNNEKRNSPGKSPGCADGDIIFSNIDIKEEQLPLHAQTDDPEEAYTLFMASNNWYLFLRLHVILCERLAKIYERAVFLADEESKQKNNRKESTAVALRLKPKPQIEVEDYYPAFLDMVKNLLDGNMESSMYEDTLREMFGIHAYIAFTLDKVVSYAVRQLQHCVTERTAVACMEMFQKEQKRSGAGGPCSTAHRRFHQELAYQRAIEKVQDENCFKIYIYKKDCKLTIEMIDTETEEPKKLEEAKKWSSYKDKFVECSSTINRRLPLYLNRNLKKYKNRHFRTRNNIICNDINDIKIERRDDELSVSNKRQSDGGEKRDNKRLEPYEELEKKLNERLPSERNQTDHPGYVVSDDTQCRLDSANAEVTYTADKGSILYKYGAFGRAKETHAAVTKRLAVQFHAWLKKWVSSNVTDVQLKQCTDWFMGRGENVVPNRTRIQTNNDYTRTPYAVYNKYHVERLKDDSAT